MIFRCLPKAAHFPPDYPIWCIEKPAYPIYAINCCSTDKCNKNITFEFPKEGERFYISVEIFLVFVILTVHRSFSIHIHPSFRGCFGFQFIYLIYFHYYFGQCQCLSSYYLHEFNTKTNQKNVYSSESDKNESWLVAGSRHWVYFSSFITVIIDIHSIKMTQFRTISLHYYHKWHSR